MLDFRQMEIKVLFENEDVLVLDKPAGLSVHADGQRQEYTLTDYILERYPQLDGVGEDMIISGKPIQKIKPKMWNGQIEDPGFAFKTKKERIAVAKNKKEGVPVAEELTVDEEPTEVIVKRPGIVHRLDKETSGCLVVAKNSRSYEFLKKQFQEREVKKEYIGVVSGWVKNDSGMIDLPLARSKADFRKQDTALNKKGGVTHRGEEREAITRYKVLERGVIDLKGEKGEGRQVKFSKVAFFPMTGRTHQIRVHAKSIGHPILADHLYGKKDVALEAAIFGDSPARHMLHARRLTFTLPGGVETAVEAPVPGEFLFA
jgi:RluA family pseudouridine synthase